MMASVPAQGTTPRKLRTLSGELAATKCLYGSGERTCRFLGHASSGFQCLAIQPMMRDEIDRRTAIGINRTKGSQCDNPFDDTSQTKLDTTVEIRHAPNVNFGADNIWMAYCTCGWRESYRVKSSSSLRGPSILDRSKAERAIRLVVVNHLIDSGEVEAASDYRSFYRLLEG